MERGICKCCGRETFIQNKKRYFCSDCIYKLNHSGKSQVEVSIEKERKKPPKIQKIIKCKEYIYKPKSTGERQLFLEIWLERNHICENCKVYLGEEPKSHYFSHIISKGVNSKLRLEKSNIKLLCYDCHYALDHRGKLAYEKRTR